VATFENRSVVVSDVDGNNADVTPAGALKVDGSGVTQPVSGDFNNDSVGENGVGAPLFSTQVGGPDSDGNLDSPRVLTSAPGAGDPGFVVRNVPSGTQAVSAAALPLPTGAATSANQTTLGNQTTKINDGTNTAAVKAASTAPVATDPALVVTISPNSTIPLAGNKSNNGGAPGANNLGVLPAVATAAAPAYTEGNQVAASTLLNGSLRTDNTSWLGSTAPTVGQKTMAASLPVVLASDQSAIPVSFTPSASTASAVTQVAGSLVVVTLQALNAARKGLTLYNDGNQAWYVKLGAAATLTSFTAQIPRNGYYEVPFGWTGIVTGIQAVAANFLYVTELT
jgi:hypothetical protein